MGLYFPYSSGLEKELDKYGVEYVVEETEESKQIYLDNTISSRINNNLRADILTACIADFAPLLNRGFSLRDHMYTEMLADSPGVLMISSYGDGLGKLKRDFDFVRYDTLAFNGLKEKNVLGQMDVNAYEPPEYGVGIIDGDGICVGFYSYMHIHFFFDFFHTATIGDLHHLFLRSCIADYLRIKDQLKELFDFYDVEEARRKFIDGMKKRADANAVNARRRLTTIDNDLRMYVESITALQQEKITKFNEIKAYEANQIDFEAEFDRLFSEFRAQFDANLNFYFITDTIEIDGIILGRFRITMNNNGTFSVVNIDNKIVNKNGEYDHPHVLNSNMCLGNIAVQVAELIGQHKLFDAAYLVRESLYFYNREGQYIEIEAWMTPEQLEEKARAEGQPTEAAVEAAILEET